jgi:ABC-type Zn2+ transport system substrate-binding protein/surface adhesin
MTDSNTDLTNLYKQERQRLRTKIDRYKREIEEDEKKVQALEILIGDTNHSIVEDHYPEVIENNYPYDGTWTDKLLWVLDEIKEGTAREIADSLIEIEGIENESTQKTVRNTITLYCSRLLAEQQLEARQIGKTNVYSINEDYYLL